MGWSIPLGSIAGTEIRLHLTFLLLLGWIAISHGAAGGAGAAVAGLAFIALLFLCVLLHEFGHVFAARRYGVRTPDITLLPIGGVARLERIPEEPAQELVVALAGPAVNLAIALLLALLLGGVPDPAALAQPEQPGPGLAERLFWVNVSLVLFNLLPAFPMDGGRVLRALLALRMGYRRATEVAAMVGQGLALLLGVVGLFGGAPLLAFVALFVWLGAAAENQAVQLRAVSRGLLAADAAVTRFESLAVGASVDEAAELLLRTEQTDLPVVDGAGRLRGVLTRDAIIRALREASPSAPVLEAMQADIPAVHHRAPLEDALRAMQGAAVPAVAVTDGTGRLVGLITPANIADLMLIEAVRPRRAALNPWARGA